ncbi:hypothetical protein DFQ26_000223, partial [Actinomortierella ambigua]
MVNALQANLEALYLSQAPARQPDYSATALGQRGVGQGLYEAYAEQKAAMLQPSSPPAGVALDDIGNEIPLHPPADLEMTM